MNFTLLKALFASFLRARHIARHFRRLAMLESLARTGVSRDIPAPLSQSLSAAAHCDAQALLQRLASRAEGLSDAQAEAIRAREGLNEIEREKPLPWWRHLWHCFRNPFNLLLTLLAAISLLTDDLKAAIVIAAMVALSTLLRFWQEARSNAAAEALKKMVANTATVLRPGPARAMGTSARGCAAPRHARAAHAIELPIRQLVPGDVVALSAGDMIPADCRVLVAKDLFVSQAAMTGESTPAEKFATQRDARAINPLELDNILYMGTNVVSGSATAVVLATGNHTYFGALAGRVAAVDRAPTSFEAGVNKVSWLLIRFMLVMAPLVLLINGFTKGDWLEAVLFALSIAVGLTPEMLPMIVTATLAKGAVALSRRQVVVKRLDAVQNFGAMDVLCTDKTGTLTQDRVAVARHVDIWGRDSDEVLELAYLNSYYQTGLKNLLDVAVLEHAEVHRELQPARNYRKVDEVPFDFARRRMSVVVAGRDGSPVMITKGAVDEMLAACAQVRHGDAVQPLTPALLARIRAVTGRLNDEGLRVIGVATRQLPPTGREYGVADERDLVLAGYVAFRDPPKESAAPALAALAAHGVAVKLLTGDNERVAAKICQEVGLPSRGLLLGADIERMSDRTLAAAVESHDIYARLTPAHKERIVSALKAGDRVVGFLGDGINDAPALRAADVGISVDTAVDIAKEAADIILLEKSLMVLEAGVREGRRTFANMLKYIKMTASSNFGNVFSVLVASAFLPFLPMLPIHLLVQNLLYDISQIAIPFDNVDEDLLSRPQRWQPADIGRFMLFFGPISSIFDIATYAMMWFVFGADTPREQTLFQSGWFIVGLLTQTLIVHMIRTPRLPFIQSRAAAPLLLMTGLIVAIGIFLPMGPLAPYFKLQALPPLYFACLPAILLAYMGLTQIMKNIYLRRYGWQ
ncbi:magnesium-translocating P-type ATPase [Bordetella genomosp. 2]|uniref:Magnesium-transporting ATPase, P-type 1 n=1 Tax=Bordetella genomosp. 2 TaxID=1983456 RepID=A0A261VZP9_9BORD|nr:magnesium-translocating P-type ATPase [Bordetella genomosp. 2]OZI79574.1 magnesium-translocating P-type ATPase [Bordetella genomosp. 2]